MNDDITTIALAVDTRDQLFRLKDNPDETYDDVVRDLIDEDR